MKKLLLSIALMFFILFAIGQNVWINEFHYDNAGSDVGEFIEVVIENPGSYTLSDFAVYLYNGNNGTTYDNESVNDFTVGATVGNFTIYTWAPTSIQNGAPDGLAVIYQGAVVSGQFLSYEGFFTATDGPANGLTSTDIGVLESSSTPAGHSLQLSGGGTVYSDFTWQNPAAETPGNENNNQSLGGTVTPTIVNAFAISETAMDVFYTTNLTSVSATDFVLTGSATITFTTATIDGSDGTLVHLTGASASMTGDITLDNIEDAVNNSNFDFYTGIMPVAYVNTTNPGGTMNDVNIATFQGIVSANDNFNNVWISDAAGAYNGVMIYSSSFDGMVDVGDEILITAMRDTYNNLTELVNPELISTISTGNSPYGPTIIDGSDIDESIGEDTDPGEKWEGQFVTIENFTVESYTDYDYRCSWTDGTATYYFHIGDNVVYQFGGVSLNVGSGYSSITGVVDWENDGPNYRINPREQSDIVGATLAVTAPNGGEIIQQNQQYEITWTYSYWDGPVKIDLLKGGANPVTIAFNIPVSDGSFLWNVFSNLALGDDYSIRISGINAGDPSDESDGYFTVIEPWIIPQIVFSEIMYNPPESGNDSLEFLEFFNKGDEAVNMEGFYMSMGVEHTFPSVVIEPDTFFLLAKDSLAMFAVFGVESYQWTSGALGNSGEAVELTDKYGNILNTVQYDDSPPWDSLADGYGPSLELISPALDNTLGENWMASVNFMAVNADGDSIWASPGFGFSELVAAFEVDENMIVVDDSVMFTDLTTGNPTSWMWTFEGGMPETFDGETPPYIVYDSVGKWDVTLVVSDGYKTDSVTYEEYITVGIMPVADFEAEDTQVTAGSYTNFMSLAIGDSLTYQWTFEGGTPDTSSAENPTEIYYNIDEWATYDVTLVVSNAFGSDTLTKEDYIEVLPVGISENIFNDNTVTVYPNPVVGDMVISIPAGISADFMILNMNGQSVFDGKLSGNITINLDHINSGVYFVKIVEAKSRSVIVKRIVVK